MSNFLDMYLCFIIYSFIGWVCEMIYCYIIDKKLVNRGFVTGPFCPIYGFGALAIIFLLKPLTNSFFLVFIAGMIITSVIEYFASYILEIIFHTSWWDYSKEKFNINGRICLKNSILFGLLGVVLHFYVDGYIMNIVTKMSRNDVLAICVTFTLIFSLDFTHSVIIVLQLNKRVMSLANIKVDLFNKYNELISGIENESLSNWISKIEFHQEELATQVREKLKTLKESEIRIINAFPKMKNKRYNLKLEKLKDFLKK